MHFTPPPKSFGNCYKIPGHFTSDTSASNKFKVPNVLLTLRYGVIGGFMCPYYCSHLFLCFVVFFLFLFACDRLAVVLLFLFFCFANELCTVCCEVEMRYVE